MTESRRLAPDFAPVTARATASYGLGFLAYLPVPVISMVAAAIVMIALYPGQRRNGGVASENGRRAANWGITVLASVFVLTAGLAAALLTTEPTTRIAMLLTALGYVLLSTVHAVVVTIGVIFTMRGRIFPNPIAIPFIREPRGYSARGKESA